MRSTEVITHAAHAEARRLRPVHDDAELAALAEAGRALPTIRVFRNAEGRLDAEGRGHEGHDNAGRMPFVCDFLKERVLPLIDPEVDVRGAYRIELHDAYSYLPSRRPHVNALSFGRPKGGAESVALLPDPYQMADYGGLLSVRDAAVPWTSKAPVLFFAGTTTGDRDPTKNERIRACVWSLAHHDSARFYITNVAQMTLQDAVGRVPDLRAALRPAVPVADHFAFKYQVNIAGNTACWSRVPMIMASRCLMLELPQRDATWYSHLLSDGVHYVAADGLDDLLKKRAFCMANDAWCEQLTVNANRFVRSYLGSAQAAAYTAQLLEAAASAGAP